MRDLTDGHIGLRVVAAIGRVLKTSNPSMPLLLSALYLGFFAHVPGERHGVVGDFLHVPNGAEALLVVGWMQRQKTQENRFRRCGAPGQTSICHHF